MHDYGLLGLFSELSIDEVAFCRRTESDLFFSLSQKVREQGVLKGKRLLLACNTRRNCQKN